MATEAVAAGMASSRLQPWLQDLSRAVTTLYAQSVHPPVTVGLHVQAATRTHHQSVCLFHTQALVAAAPTR